MRILPVIDVQHGVVVRGVAGRRHDYRPIVSQWTSSTAPLDLARAFRDRFGFTQLYLADLDAIAGQPPSAALYDTLQDDGFYLWVDAGLRDAGQLRPLMACGIENIIAGLETLAGPDALREMLAVANSGRIVFSLDLKSGQPLGNRAAWNHGDDRAIATQALTMGVERMIVLDLAGVGMDGGVGTEVLCNWLRERDPMLQIITGGGVRDERDLMRLWETKVNWALVASALHDGRIMPIKST